MVTGLTAPKEQQPRGSSVVYELLGEDFASWPDSAAQVGSTGGR